MTLCRAQGFEVTENMTQMLCIHLCFYFVGAMSTIYFFNCIYPL